MDSPKFLGGVLVIVERPGSARSSIIWTGGESLHQGRPAISSSLRPGGAPAIEEAQLLDLDRRVHGPLFRGYMDLLGAGHHLEERLRGYREGKVLEERAAIWEYLLVPPVPRVRIVEE